MYKTVVEMNIKHQRCHRVLETFEAPKKRRPNIWQRKNIMIGIQR